MQKFGSSKRRTSTLVILFCVLW